jgi:hypothetical protein
MDVSLEIRPYTQRSKEDFIVEANANEVAIDGFVLGGGAELIERGDSSWVGIVDHHVGDRSALMSTCEQVFEGLRNGLFVPLLSSNPSLTLISNSPDEDVLTTYALFKNWEKILHNQRYLQRARMIQYFEGKLDRNIGIYPINNKRWLHRLMYLFEPYQRLRYGSNSSASKEELLQTYEGIIDETLRRFEHIVFQNYEGTTMLEPWGEQEVLSGGNGWKIIEETGPASRLEILREKEENQVELYALYIGEREDTSLHSWTLVSTFPALPITDLETKLNSLEEQKGIQIYSRNAWGGNRTLKGSPRETGSSFSVEDMTQFLTKYYQKKL